MSRPLAELFPMAIGGTWRRRRLIVIPILVMPILGALAGFLVPKAYEARMTILVQDPTKLSPLMTDLAIGADLKDRMPSLQALLTSKYVLLDVLKDLGQIKAGDNPSTVNAQVGNLGRALTSNLIGQELIELKVRGPHPNGLGKILATVGARFMQRVVQPANGSIDSSEEFLRKQVDNSQTDLEKAEQNFSEFKRHNAEKLPALYTANVTRLAGLQQNLEERRIELSTATAAVDDLSKRVSTLNPIVSRLEEQIVQTSSELAALRARYTDEHSEVQAALRTLKRLQEQRTATLASTSGANGADIQQLWSLAANATAPSDNKDTAPLLVQQMTQLQEADTKRAALHKEVEELSAAVDRLRSDIAEFGPIEQQGQELEHAITSSQEQHDQLAKRYDIARLAGAFGRHEEQEWVKVIDAPQDPTGTVTPPRILFPIGGLFAGFAFGIGLAVAFEVLDPRLRLVKDFERASQLPVLAFVPRLESA
jgi:polysaccharide chain length determinant protein (PEP-CTERM system associated)